MVSLRWSGDNAPSDQAVRRLCKRAKRHGLRLQVAVDQHDAQRLGGLLRLERPGEPVLVTDDPREIRAHLESWNTTRCEAKR